eukprot:PhF_6_TR21214/c0_g1_i1/m.30639
MTDNNDSADNNMEELSEGNLQTSIIFLPPNNPPEITSPTSPSQRKMMRKPKSKSVIKLLNKLNEKASHKIPITYKIHHVLNPTKASSAMLKDSDWVKVEVAYSYLTMIIILMSVITFMVDSMPQYQDDPDLFIVETISISFFTLDFVARLATTRDYGSFIRNPMTYLDLISIIPYYIDVAIDTGNTKGLFIFRVFRLTRIIRILKFGRYNAGAVILVDAMAKSGTALSILGFFLGIAVLVCSTAMFYAEMYISTWDDKNKLWLRYGTRSPFQSIFETMWWALTTLTTVGYGDAVPYSTIGKVVGGVTMILGVLVIALPVVLIGNNFQEAYVAYMQAKLIQDDNEEDEDGDGGEGPTAAALAATMGTLIALPKGFLSSKNALVCRFSSHTRWHDIFTLNKDNNNSSSSDGSSENLTNPLNGGGCQQLFYYTPTCVWDYDLSNRALRYSADDDCNVVTLYIVLDTPEIHKAAYDALKQYYPNAAINDIASMPITQARIVVHQPNADYNPLINDLQEKFYNSLLTQQVMIPTKTIPICFSTNEELSVSQILRMLPYVNMSVVVTSGQHETEISVSSMALYGNTTSHSAT